MRHNTEIDIWSPDELEFSLRPEIKDMGFMTFWVFWDDWESVIRIYENAR